MAAPDSSAKVLVTGAAGLVGQNLVIELESRGYEALVAIDKHAYNLDVLRSLHPKVQAIEADLAQPGTWQDAFAGVDVVVHLNAQITGKRHYEFERNNLAATRCVLDACRRHSVPYLVHVSSSVVNSVVDDSYTRTKQAQEALIASSGLRHCILRPTLMFGWFDPKHLGWLSRFMARVPVFPVPGDGRFMRQPLYERDFCRCLSWCIENRPDGATYDITGNTRIDYIDIIRTIKRVKRLRTAIVHVPIAWFSLLLRIYALISRRPPFTADQLTALTAGDDFRGVDTAREFGVVQTPFEQAIKESFCDPRYGRIVLKR